MTFNGLRIIESLYLTQPGTPYQVRRTWPERLLSRPWRPFQATRTVVPQVPYQGAVRIDASTVAMHPAMVRQLRETCQ